MGVTGGVVCVVGGGGELVTKWQIVMERGEEAVSPGTVVYSKIFCHSAVDKKESCGFVTVCF